MYHDGELPVQPKEGLSRVMTADENKAVSMLVLPRGRWMDGWVE